MSSSSKEEEGKKECVNAVEKGEVKSNKEKEKTTLTEEDKEHEKDEGLTLNWR